MNTQEAAQAIQDALAKGAIANRIEAGKEGGEAIVLNYVAIFTFIDDKGERSYGWVMSPDLRTFEARGLISEMLADLDANEVIARMVALAAPSDED